MKLQGTLKLVNPKKKNSLYAQFIHFWDFRMLVKIRMSNIFICIFVPRDFNFWVLTGENVFGNFHNFDRFPGCGSWASKNRLTCECAPPFFPYHRPLPLQCATKYGISSSRRSNKNGYHRLLTFLELNFSPSSKIRLLMGLNWYKDSYWFILIHIGE